MRLRSTYDRGFVDGFRLGQREVTDAAMTAATRAHAATTAGQRWLVDLTRDARRLHRIAEAAPPPEADLLRTPPERVRAVTRHLPPSQARQAAYRRGLTDGRIAGVGVAARDLYQAARQNLGSLRPAIDRQPAHRWLETARRQWDRLATRGDAPLPGTSAAMARATLTGAATPTHAIGTSTIGAAQPVHAAARPAPASVPPAGRAATTPAPARGVARVLGPAPRR